jgi:hypothetical protein
MLCPCNSVGQHTKNASSAGSGVACKLQHLMHVVVPKSAEQHTVPHEFYSSYAAQPASAVACKLQHLLHVVVLQQWLAAHSKCK